MTEAEQDVKATTVQAARAEDWPAVADLLRAAGLPLAGAEEHLARFVAVREDGRIVAVGGLEVHAGAALLRSVAVAPERRGSGIGRLVVERLSLIHI